MTDGPLDADARAPGPTLGELGQLLVTQSALDRYRESAGGQPEEARRELTALLMQARERPDGSWRYRSRSIGLDVSARVSREGGLVVVTHVQVRRYQQTGTRRQ